MVHFRSKEVKLTYPIKVVDFRSKEVKFETHLNSGNISATPSRKSLKTCKNPNFQTLKLLRNQRVIFQRPGESQNVG